MSNYARADMTAQWFQSAYPGATMTPTRVVLHTTEGTSWPGYEGGKTAPHYTARPDFTAQRLVWRAHFPDEKSARALRNLPGGVETNTHGAIQVELVGTCDQATHRKWGNTPHVYWPEAPEWALRDLAAFLADMRKRHGIPLSAPAFVAYPGSYGDSAVRMDAKTWRDFTGVCGHQHVPENTHGDPGALDMPRVLEMARELRNPSPPATNRGPVTRGGRVDAAMKRLRKARDHHQAKGNTRQARLIRQALRRLRDLPTRPKRK